MIPKLWDSSGQLPAFSIQFLVFCSIKRHLDVLLTHQPETDHIHGLRYRLRR